MPQINLLPATAILSLFPTSLDDLSSSLLLTLSLTSFLSFSLLNALHLYLFLSILMHLSRLLLLLYFFLRILNMRSASLLKDPHIHINLPSYGLISFRIYLLLPYIHHNNLPLFLHCSHIACTNLHFFSMLYICCHRIFH